LLIFFSSQFRLCGYPPFYADNAPALFKKIMDVKYDFDDPSWDDVSEAAKNLIRHLLVKDPKDRYTAKDCLADPWVQGQASDAKTIHVSEIKLK
jgi:serine/threonine protein kinase